MSKAASDSASIETLENLLETTDARVVVRAVKDAKDDELAIFLLKLSNASPVLRNHAAQILIALPTEKQATVAEQITKTEVVESTVVEDVYQRLVNRIQESASEIVVFGDGTSNLVRLMARMKIDQQNQLLDALAERQPVLVNEVRSRIFTFVDLAKLTDDGLRSVLQMLDVKTVALALHDVPSKIREKFLRNLSAESAEAVESEMSRLTFEETGVSNTARQSIVSLVRKFAAKGMIKIDTDFGDAVDV